LVTLKAAGLIQYFDTDVVLGRDCAPPKPSPQGVLTILHHWNATPEDAVMVGDFHFDIEAGYKAGASTVQVLRGPTLIHRHATIVLNDLGDLIL
jgi:phosphoglycolate phosphatase-like HAD superfamily hydrolase